MAVNLGSNDGGDLAENADINITPFIDVILVLLIIFMVAAPLSTVDVPVELPVSAAPQQPRPDKPIFVSVKADLGVALGEDAVDRPALGAALDAATKGNKDERIFLRADKGVPYGELMGVMNLLRGAGYLKVGLVGLEDTSGGGQP
ncbi:UNVERIFIED_ORG: biopolymer transport protein ExbD [Methylobacterium sp. SuP10 SLI 274]|uniref:TonB system transport protein ExbD n=1 Tax=Methylorubrum extorquens TaxID=408 RepID=UPI0020A1F88E|nr:TonB system transport protein ExbD [Methylorubrum extorquens]MDF9862436.1 biopolymer transport protein ExbD [Methylorubrum pseudosasae]MDH6636050.1 biopolymer transport protein ExbD [Methylobacterium sp. SuP10 SLI 274]MDH6665224.1 biopolymer transport protein ExbD [Methylorubrum zatmanii]MCP1557151.1 biopolymer transport protein ExbD [Methylorubrum extorquens]MDF9790729.1 biopolymer transport protein ExbD [Methylorubrum extorquens]